MKPTIYNIQVSDIKGQLYPLSKYQDKVILIVNTASGCGFAPQLKGLEELYQEFKAEGLVVLGFPSNDFGKQEPLSTTEISEFCQVNYGVSFPMHEKIMVRGNMAHPLYRFLANKDLNQNLSSTPRWNFHKYLINRKGEVVDYFYSFTKPESTRIRKRIKKLLAEK